MRFGFDFGIDVSKVRGRRWFKNYSSAHDAADGISSATLDRLESGRTIALCPVAVRDARVLPWPDARVFPLGGVPKPHEPSVIRPVSDHTRTGLKEATVMDFLRHRLDTYADIARFLRLGSYMRMSDVDGAFTLLPIAPRLWPFFMFWWKAVTTLCKGARRVIWWLYQHLTADFGAAGVPGTFKIFFSDVIMGVARSENILTLDHTVYVDDCAHVGPDQAALDREGGRTYQGLRDTHEC
jgi:hypothetical protein